VFDELAPGTIIDGRHGRYEMLNMIGRGGMGVVYRARRHNDGSVWAVKELRPDTQLSPSDLSENRRLFEHEAQLILRLDHPNVVGGQELFEWNTRLYLVMELVPGETLEKRLRDANAPAFEGDALRWAIQMARVFAYLHGQQPPIIYRDLKPANVMLLPDGTVRFIDFGVARTHKFGKSKDTVAIGTLGYAPPEQYGKDQTDARSDIYTLGATLYHLLTNVPPRPLYTPKSGEIMAFNPSVQPRTEQVVIRAMEQERGQRFPSATAMEQAMQACLAVLVPQATAAPIPVAAAPTVPDARVRPAPPLSTVPKLPPLQQPAPKAAPSTRSSVPPARSSVPPARSSVPAPSTVSGTPRFCPNCGFGNTGSARFCVNCGTTLPAVPTPTASPPTTAPPPTIAPARTRPQRNGQLHVRTPRRAWEHPLQVLPCRIGRRDPAQAHYPELDLAEDDSGHASRRHAVIDRRNGEFVLTDNGSINGTLLNGVKIAPHRAQPLHTGDRIRIGDVEMRFEEQ
jgi:serine/threonine protein kinase